MTRPHGQPRPEQLCMRLSPETRAILEHIKRDSGLANDAAVIRAALGLQHHISRRLAEGCRIYLSAPDGGIARELTLPEVGP